MSGDESFLKGKYILAVDDEKDILETITDILNKSVIDWAWEYQNASKKIKTGKYDLVILDIMGVNGLQLLEESVNRGFPTVMLTAHALNPATLMESIQKGAISYLTKEKLSELDDLLNAILEVVGGSNLRSESLADDVCREMRFDLCCNCRQRFLENPLGREVVKQFAHPGSDDVFSLVAPSSCSSSR